MSLSSHFPNKKIYFIDNIEFVRNSKEYYKSHFVLAKSAKKILLTPLYSDEKNLTVKLYDFYRKNENIRIFRSVKFYRSVLFSLKKYIETILSVFHSKIYIFDKNLILTSANMNYRYFKEIEDRYFIVRVPEMAADLYNRYIDFQAYNIENIIMQGNTEKLIYAELPNREIFNKKIFSFTENEEKEIISKILTEYSEEEIYICTPYCNFPSYYIPLLEKIKNLKIFLPSNSMNTHQKFFFDWFVKHLYSVSIYFLGRRLGKKLFLLRKNKYGQLFHKKGLWIFTKNKVITLIGSSSYNRRSNYRDNELTFLIESTDNHLNKIFREEIVDLESRVTGKQIKRPFLIFIFFFFIFGALL